MSLEHELMAPERVGSPSLVVTPGTLTSTDSAAILLFHMSSFFRVAMSLQLIPANPTSSLLLKEV